MRTKEEALAFIDELEKKVDEELALLRKGSEVLEKRALEQAGEIKQLRGINEDLKKQAQVEFDRAERLLKERDSLQYTLNGYGDLAKALGKIRGASVDIETVRKVVQEELAKAPSAGTSAEGVRVTESIPSLELQVSRPWLTLDESTLAGMITVLALKDKLSGKFGFGDVIKTLEVEYSWKAGGGSQRRRVQEALDELVGKYKALERAHDTSANQVLYELRADARGRVKEKETREIKAVTE